MSAEVVYRLLAIVAIVAAGYAAGRTRWLRNDAGELAPTVQAVSSMAVYLLMPALLFRTTAHLNFQQWPWTTLAAYFLPLYAILLGVYVIEKRRGPHPQGPAVPAVRGITATFGNTLQVGIPLITALYGAQGMAIHVTIISVHALTILTLTTTLAEWDLARARAEQPHALDTVVHTLRQTLIHPVVLPVVAGLVLNLSGLGLHPAADMALQTLATGVVPVCLLLIGLSLSHYGFAGHWQGGLRFTALKMLLQPAAVLALGHWGFGLSGVTLSALVIAAALPVGSNPLIFAQRYRTLEAEATLATVVSTLSVLWVVPLWLAVLHFLGLAPTEFPR